MTKVETPWKGLKDSMRNVIHPEKTATEKKSRVHPKKRALADKSCASKMEQPKKRRGGVALPCILHTVHPVHVILLVFLLVFVHRVACWPAGCGCRAGVVRVTDV